MTYTPAGAIKDLRLGNGLYEYTGYNSRLQVEEIRLGTTPGGINRLNLTYSYGTTDNNGNVQSQTITVPTVGTISGFTVTQSYTYDALNRLESAEEMNASTQVWKQGYKYDRYGNRTIDISLDQNSLKKTSDNVKPALLSDNPTLNPATNQISINQGYAYEGAGNLIAVPNRADQSQSYRYEYDAENRQISFDRDPVATPSTKDATYVYDGDGRRVKKVADGVTTIFVYDIAGKLVAEYSSAGSAGGGTSYLTSDTLGTPRVITGSDITDGSGGVKARHDYLPFGEEVFVGRSSYAGDSVRQKFTGKERDIETGLDYFLARYYSSSQGRFTSVDPLAASAMTIAPQTFNRYSYVLNNPLRFIDPDGRCTIPAGLKAGQVGICVEAFIASSKINGYGYGDNRTHQSNDPNADARMRTSVVLTATADAINMDVREELISPSFVGTPVGDSMQVVGVGLRTTGEINHEVTALFLPKGTPGFGDGLYSSTVVRIGLRKGTNGGQVLGETIMAETFNPGFPVKSLAGILLGTAVIKASPVGTIDVEAQIRITGSGDNINVTATSQARPFPSITGWAYVGMSDGSVKTIQLFQHDETKPSDLTKPMRPIK